MLLLFGFGMGMVFVVLGLATLSLAPKMGPNPVFACAPCTRWLIALTPFSNPRRR